MEQVLHIIYLLNKTEDFLLLAYLLGIQECLMLLLLLYQMMLFMIQLPILHLQTQVHLCMMMVIQDYSVLGMAI